jgi:hypothetical protein
MQTTSLFHERAQHRVFLGFYIHLAVFILVNAALGAMNLMRNPDRPWFLWVVAGWGVGVFIHGLLTYMPQTRERSVHKIAERLERRNARRERREPRREERPANPVA